MKGQIALENVSVRFGTGATQVDAACNVTFDIKPGEFVTLIGPSGCGKSTLLT